MEEEGGDPSNVNKNPMLIKAAQEGIESLDIFMCGICRDVFHFVPDFIKHREKKCNRSKFTTNMTETKPQVWGFLLWKNTIIKRQKSQEGGGTIHSWKLYQKWCKLEDNIKDSWIAAGKALQCYSMLAHAKLQEVRIQSDGKTIIGDIKPDENEKHNSKELHGEKPQQEEWNNASDLEKNGKTNAEDSAAIENTSVEKKISMEEDSIEIKEEKLSEEEGSRGDWETEDMDVSSRDLQLPLTTPENKKVPIPDSNKVTRRIMNRPRNEGDSEEEYVVEKILAKRFNPKKKYFEYLLKWEGYPHEQNTWEPVHNMAACDKLVETFERNLAKQKAAQQAAQAQISRPPQNMTNRKLINPTAIKGLKQLDPGPSGTESGRPVRSSKKKALEQVKSWCGSMAKTTEFGKRKLGESSESDEDDEILEKKVKLEPPDDEEWSGGELGGSQISSGDENMVTLQGNQTKVVGVIHKSKEQLFSPIVKRSPGRPRKIRPEEASAINGIKARKPEDTNDLAIKLGLESDSSPESKTKSVQPGIKVVGQPPVLVANSKGVIKVDPRQVPNLTSGVYIVANKSNVVKLDSLPTSPPKGKVLGMKQPLGKVESPKPIITSGIIRKPLTSNAVPLRPVVPGPIKVLGKPGPPGRLPSNIQAGLVKVSPPLTPRSVTPSGPRAAAMPRIIGPRPSVLPTRGNLLQTTVRPAAPSSIGMKRPLGVPPGVNTKITTAVKPRVTTVGGKVLSPLTAQTKSGVKPIQAMLGKAVQGQALPNTMFLAKKKEGDKLTYLRHPVTGARLEGAKVVSAGRGRGRGIVGGEAAKQRESKLAESDSVHMEFHQVESSSESESSDSLPELPMGEMPALEPESPPRPFTLCPETGKILGRAEGEPTPPPSPPTPPPAPKDEPQPEEPEEILPDQREGSPLRYSEGGETLLKVEMSPGGTTGTVIESSVSEPQYVDTLRTDQGLTVTKIASDSGKSEQSVSAVATVEAQATTSKASSGGISVPARKLFLEGGKINPGEVVTVQGEDGVVYHIATEGQEELEGEGMHQCVYVTTEQGEGGEESAVLTLDTAVAEAVAQLMPEQVNVIGGGCSQFYIKEGESSAASGEGAEQLVMASVVEQQGADDGSPAQVVAHVVQEGEIIPGTGKRRVVLLLPDGNLMMTDVDEEQYAALSLDK